jgi:hypothetical protein
MGQRYGRRGLPMKRGNRTLLWVGYLFWGLFVNACNIWIVKPLVLDLAIYGVVAVTVIVVLWMTSIPRSNRRSWIVFTLFSLLVGDGVSELSSRPLLSAILLGVVMIIGLTALARLFVRVPVRRFVSTALLLVVANMALPVHEWAYLTHFWVPYHTTLGLQSSDMNAPPLTLIQKQSGTALVSLNNVKESDKQLQKIAQNTGDTSDSLENLLRNFGHRYSFVELVQQNGHFHLISMPVADIGAINPLQFDNSFFPFMRAYWSQEGNQIVQYMAPSQSPRTLTAIINQAADFPANLNALAVDSQRQEMTDWQRLLGNAGISQTSQLTVQNGHLVGSYQGIRLNVPVDGQSVIATGSFTTPRVHEALITGANLLQVVSLDRQAVVTTYHGTPQHALPNDVVVGPVDKSGREAILVNASPAFILQANPTGNWTTLYNAPNDSLRFEASVQFQSDKSPEIITNDPSFIRNSPTNYLTSYTYQNGELVRNWRVYESNTVNIRPVQFASGGPTYLVTGTNMSGKIYVLQRHHIPVLPITAALLGIIIIAGWATRLRRERGELRA